MKNKGVWKVIDEVQVPKDRRCIKNRGIFKVKNNGNFRARRVACSFSQAPGVDFEERFAPVINDVSFRLLLIAKLVWDLKSTISGIETTFLYGKLDEESYPMD
jgi:Reverse transcriptase (RNA-dependent DNA polymerase)